jgi:8-amino-7-oxononanoate synthase
MGWFEDLAARTNEAIEGAGRLRRIRTVTGGGTTTRITADGRQVVQFASNDYLGLATHPEVAAAAAVAANEIGTGAGASRLIVGSREVHDRLEGELSRWHARHLGPGTSTVLFPTGYTANLGAVTAIVAAAGNDDTVLFSDELNHASIIDGARLSRAACDIYPHLDLDELGRRLSHRSRRRAVVLSDVVFSMDGDVADVAALSRLCADNDALLVLDIAHDALDELDALDALEGVAPAAEVLVVGTLSKMLGSMGGYVSGSAPAVELLVNTARPFIFTTALAPPQAAAALAALRISRSPQGAALRAQLRANVDTLSPDHPSAILPVVLGSEHRALEVSAALLEAGLLVPAIRPPTVPDGTCRLRVAVSAAHTGAELRLLRSTLDDLGVHIRA